jgi:enoyl-CoA hydratase/carnithine racemase
VERQFVEIDLEPPVGVVRIDRPEKKNALSLDLLRELQAAARELRERTDISAVILSGTEEYFSAGMDLSDPAILALSDAPLAEQRRLMSCAPRVCRAWEDLDQVTIAAVEGFCLGGGVSLACSLDFRVMAESSYIQAPEIDYGMNMSWGTLPRLVHLIGPARTNQLIIMAERVAAREAHAWGFAQWVCPDGSAVETARRIAGKIASKPHAPVCMTKQTVNAIAKALDQTASHMDRDQFLLSVLNDESRERIVSFLSKKSPPKPGE